MAVVECQTHRYGFEPMADIVPAGTSRRVRIEHFIVNESDNLRAMCGNPDEYIVPGRYARLMINGSVVMSDVLNEQRTNYRVVREARGRVLKQAYDTIYFDIWNDQSTDDLELMTRLHRQFRYYLSPDGWMDSWNRERLRYRKEQERRCGW